MTLAQNLRLLCFAIACMSVSQGAEPEGWSCVATLTFPKYPELARQARLSGTVTLVVVRSGDTRISSTAPGLLRQAIQNIVRSVTLRPNCTRVSLNFVFSIDESRPRRTTDSGDIMLEAPARVLITAAPFPLSGDDAEHLRKN
jgi:hypothetical protein